MGVKGASEVKLYDNISPKTSQKDEIIPTYRVGQKVKLLEDVVNDGTYPYSSIGSLLMKKGAIGYIRKIGDFLQTIRIYEVHFLEGAEEMEVEVVGCREHELELLEDYKDEVDEELRFMREYRAKKYK